MASLYSLLRKTTRWSWGSQEKEEFSIAKDALQENAQLVHFDPSKPLIVACDASQYGLGAVLSHKMDNGEERPVAFASRALPAEKKYSQLEREGLAIIFSVKKFYYYIYGRHFIIESDRKPLSFLFSVLERIPILASSRIQRWSLTLSAYHYSIQLQI